MAMERWRPFGVTLDVLEIKLPKVEEVKPSRFLGGASNKRAEREM